MQSQEYHIFSITNKSNVTIHTHTRAMDVQGPRSYGSTGITTVLVQILSVKLFRPFTLEIPSTAKVRKLHLRKL